MNYNGKQCVMLCEIEISMIILAELRSNTSKIDVQIVVEVYPLPGFTLRT